MTSERKLEKLREISNPMEGQQRVFKCWSIERETSLHHRTSTIHNRWDELNRTRRKDHLDTSIWSADREHCWECDNHEMHTARNKERSKEDAPTNPNDNEWTIDVRSKMQFDTSRNIRWTSLDSFHWQDSLKGKTDSSSIQRLSIQGDIWRLVLPIDVHRVSSSPLFRASDEWHEGRSEEDSLIYVENGRELEIMFSLRDTEPTERISPKQENRLLHRSPIRRRICVIEGFSRIKEQNRSNPNIVERLSNIVTMLRHLPEDKSEMSHEIDNPNKDESIEEESRFDQSLLENHFLSDPRRNNRRILNASNDEVDVTRRRNVDWWTVGNAICRRLKNED